jgi:hypothetical protein
MPQGSSPLRGEVARSAGGAAQVGINTPVWSGPSAKYTIPGSATPSQKNAARP